MYIEQILVLPETQEICKLLGIDPLGLLGSGSLLIACKNDGCELLMSEIQQAGIQVSCIGEVLEEGFGIEAFSKSDRSVQWPHVETDELTRMMDQI